MGTFSASLRTVGDVTALPATIEISEGRLTISAGSSEIGSWSLDEVSLQEIPTGYRMIAEGDQILIELKDVPSFSAALATGAKKKRARVRKRGANETEAPVRETPETRATTTPQESIEVTDPKSVKQQMAQTRTVEEPADSPQKKPSKRKSSGSGPLAAIDTLLIGAKKRFGPYLPDFMFSRAMFFIALTALVVMVVFPGTFATLFLIAGALVVLFGAVVYTDSVLASRFLPGRATPTQALLLGLGVLLFGVLLGAIAR
jgi:hypothetical protein